MAMFDNKSRFEQVLLTSGELTEGAAELPDFQYDLTRYESYAIVVSISSPGIVPSAFSFDVQVTTADSSAGSYTQISDSELIGGSFPTITFNDYPGNGDVLIARGILNQKRFLRISTTLNTTEVGVFASITLIGKMKVSPTDVSENTSVAVV